jgi:ankyrin repeat protein
MGGIYVQVCKVLIEVGADMNILDENHMSALTLAVSEVHIDIVRLLLHRGGERRG